MNLLRQRVKSFTTIFLKTEAKIIDFMKIQRSEDGSRGRFYIEESGKRLALMTYSKAGEDKIIIDHTEVDQSLKGEGIGRDLVAEGVKYARENNLKIVPLCPFVKSEFEKCADYADVLAA